MNSQSASLSLNQAEGKVTSTPDFVAQQILHIKIWYADGTQRELNITSPNTLWGEDIEIQYIYMKMYFRKVAQYLGIKAYQGHICCVEENRPRILGTFAKTDCSTVTPFEPGQYWETKKEVNND